MTQQPQQKAPHICIATPCYGGKVFQNYYLSVLNLVYATVRQQNMNLSFIIRGGDSLITRARNSIVAEFLSNEQYTHLLWIDADIGFTPESVFRLVGANKDIAAGIYPLKAYTFPDVIPAEMTKQEFANRYTKYPFNPIGASFTVENGFAEVKDAPTGMMLIKREVFYKMIEAYPQLKYYPDHMVGLEGIAQKINDFYYNFFDTFIDDEGRYLSEDYAFCRLWQKMGGKVYADITSKLSHNGSHMFQGDLAATLSYNYKTEQNTKPTEPAPPAPEVALSTDPVSIPVDLSGLADLGIQLEAPVDDLTSVGIDVTPPSEVPEDVVETPTEPLDEKSE